MTFCGLALSHLSMPEFSPPSARAFTYFVGIELTPDIVIFQGDNIGYDGYESYRVCFQAPDARIQKILKTHKLKENKELNPRKVYPPLAHTCIRGKPIVYTATESGIEKSVLYHRETQKAWFQYFGAIGVLDR